MPAKATLEQRIRWHLEHRKHCGCRPIPAKLAEAMRARGAAVAGGKKPDRSCFTRPLTLIVLDDTFAVCRLGSDATAPPWATAGDFFSISRTGDELSVVCRQDSVPEGILCERGWRCLRVAGTIAFSVVGVLASLTTPLAQAGISVFALSTFDTDYLLVKEKGLAAAVDVLRQRGHTVR